MSVGLVEALSSAVGDELAELDGLRSTRVTAQIDPETRIDTGLDDSSSADLGITITTTGSFDGELAGDVLRLLSGPDAGKQAEIVTPGAGSIVLRAPGIGANFSSESWEIVRRGATSAPVETTLDWDDSGQVVIAGTRYRYGSKTLTSLGQLRPFRHLARSGTITVVGGASLVDGQGILLDDGEGIVRFLELDSDGTFSRPNLQVDFTAADSASTVRDAYIGVINASELNFTASIGGTAIVSLVHNTPGGTGFIHCTDTVADAGFVTDGPFGIERQHDTLDEAVDFTRNLSSVDTYRRSFLVDFATGEDLSVIGRMLGVPRPSALVDDEIYRLLVKAVAYSPRGTVHGLELALTALLGAGNFEIFEDLGLGSINNPATVFFRRTDDKSEVSSGKTFLDPTRGTVTFPTLVENPTGLERNPVDSTTQITLNQDPIRVSGVRLADDPLPVRLIDRGNISSISGSGVTFNDGSSSISANVRRGDVWIALSGANKGARATIDDVTSVPASFDIGPVRGSAALDPGFADGTVDIDYIIVRTVSNFRHYRPSDETYIEHEGDTGTAIWDYTGSAPGNETTNVTLADTASEGEHLDMNDPLAAETTLYRHRLRIQPESRFEFELRVLIPAGATVASGATDGLQFAVRIQDGSRQINLGLFDSGAGASVDWGPVDNTGTAIGSNSVTVLDDVYTTIRIVKNNQDDVEFWFDGQLQFVEPIANFDAVAAANPQVEFGMFSTTLAGMDAHLKYVDWFGHTDTDYWNVHLPSGTTTATDRITDGGAGGFFEATDVGKSVRVKDFTALNASDGNAVDEWEIAAVISPPNSDVIDVIGRTQKGAQFDAITPNRVTVRGDRFPFRFPGHLGHSIEIIDGVNVGTFVIDKFLDPVTFKDLALNDDLTARETVTQLSTIVSSAADIPFLDQTNVIEVVGGGFANTDDEATWRLIPDFPADTGPVPYELVDAGTAAAAVLTLRQALPISLVGSYVPLVEVEYSSVLSAQLLDERDRNTEPSTGVFAFYPFYLFDDFGFVRDILDILTAAGVIPDFDRFFRDSTGPHLIED